MANSRAWADAEFGDVDLGDIRRTARLVTIAAAAAERPSGKVAGVFPVGRELEGAYDFLESEHVAPEEIMAGIAAATATRCVEWPFVFVPVDGTSVSVVDHTKRRDFGRVGSDKQDGRGAKVIDALAVDPEGTPLGWLALTFWARPIKSKSPPKGTHAHRARPVEEKEARFWIQSLVAASAALDERKTRGWFQIDREGDSADLLLALRERGLHWWTVRSDDDRSIELENGDRSHLRAQLASAPISGEYALQVRARAGRHARKARMVVRIADVVLRLRKRKNDAITRFPVTAVWAREEGTTPPGEKPLDWLLFTNHPVTSLEDAVLVIYGYSQRWRVEDCHRTWKGGECDIESTQLRSFDALQRWATIMAAVATRIERLKGLSRNKPDAPATLELSHLEVRALKLLKFGAESPTTEPTLHQAVLWLAELGGWANKYSGEPPGATVLGRGLRYLRPAARLLALQAGCEK